MSDLLKMVEKYLNDANGPHYEEIERAVLRANAEDVPLLLEQEDSNLLESIRNFAERQDVSLNKVIDKIKSDTMFAKTFARDPNRTGLHKDCARRWLRRFLGIHVEKLPTSGKHAVYVTKKGEIRTLHQNQKRPSKALDFRWKFGDMEFYAKHKHVKQSGGAQDNQIGDLIEILRLFQVSTDTKKVLFIIGDGDYAQQKMDVFLELIRENPPRSYALPIHEVPKVMMKYGVFPTTFMIQKNNELGQYTLEEINSISRAKKIDILKQYINSIPIDQIVSIMNAPPDPVFTELEHEVIPNGPVESNETRLMPFPNTQAYQNVLDRLDNLEKLTGNQQQPSEMIGHNNPPSSIDDDNDISSQEWIENKDDILVMKDQMKSQNPDDAEFTRRAFSVGNFLNRIAILLKSKLHEVTEKIVANWLFEVICSGMKLLWALISGQ